MTEDKQPTLVGVNTEFGENADGLFLKKTQEIPQHLLDDLKDQRNQSTTRREGEFMMVASIPAVVAEKWLSEGSNILDPNVNGQAIVRRLKAENHDGFLATAKEL